MRQVWVLLRVMILGALLASMTAHAQSAYSSSRFSVSIDDKAAFADLYKEELGDTYHCEDSSSNEIGVCANSLKNAGNAARIFIPKNTPKSLIVLFHGLSDSPYFVSAIAKDFQAQGHLVIAPLIPGHGKKVAGSDMKDDRLKERWLQHLEEVMNYAEALADKQALRVFAGGYSAGATLATWYALNHPDSIAGVVLFSGAFALSDSAETMSRIWGIKSVAKWLDGDYVTAGPHPFKYPGVASYSALVLLDLINEIRAKLSEQSLAFPIFAAHSMADKITLFTGIEDLISAVEGQHVVFKIDKEYDVCHQDLPIGQFQMVGLKFDRSQVNQKERCAIPKPNPLHMQMMIMANSFIEEQLDEQ